MSMESSVVPSTFPPKAVKRKRGKRGRNWISRSTQEKAKYRAQKADFQLALELQSVQAFEFSRPERRAAAVAGEALRVQQAQQPENRTPDQPTSRPQARGECAAGQCKKVLASCEVETVFIGQKGDPNYAEVHFWSQESDLDLAALAKQQNWRTQLQFNGRHSAFVTDKYMHSALVDDSVAGNMAGSYFNHGNCSPDNPGGSLRGLMAIDSELQSNQDRRFVVDVCAMTRSKHLTLEGLDRLNFLVGRAYCSDQGSGFNV